MITKVINTCNFGVRINNYSKNKYTPINNQKLSRDTISFSGKASQNLIESTVNLAFNKLKNSAFIGAHYSGISKNKVNVNIQKTDYYDNLILSLTNIKFNNNNFALFEFNKPYNNPSKIISLGKNTVVKDETTVKMLKDILENLH